MASWQQVPSFAGGTQSGTHTPQQERILMVEDEDWIPNDIRQAYWNSYSLQPLSEFAADYIREHNDSMDGYFHSHVFETSTTKRSKTLLPQGTSMLVDLGSRINLVGSETLKEFVATAKEHGYETLYRQRERPLLVNGVGAGSAPCYKMLEVPVSVKYGNAKQAQVIPYQANIAEGCGSKLPAILGLDSMTEKDAVLILRDGKRCMAFPGKGGYKIEWSPGTKILPLDTSPSGHLVIPCDQFHDAIVESAQTFVTDHTVVEATQA